MSSGRGEGKVSVPPGTEDVTVLAGSSFCRSDRSGDIQPQHAGGLFVHDTRILSLWELTVDGLPLEALGVAATEPFAATFVGRAGLRPGTVEPTVVMERHRSVADGLRERIVVRNFGSEPVSARLELAVGADFADLFDVKDGRPAQVGVVQYRAVGDCLDMEVLHKGRHVGVRVQAPGAMVSRGLVAWQFTVGAHEEWHRTVEVSLSEEDNPIHPAASSELLHLSPSPERRMRDWRRNAPVVVCENRLLQAVLDRSTEDLGALRITNASYPDLDVVAAGAPWFMALFGRDSLLTSWFALPWDPALARGTLHTLARLQGNTVDVLSEEEPGRILHEVRLGVDPTRALGASPIYYGSVDATPLFVMLLGEAARWGMSDEDIDALLPAADRALAWVTDNGDVDGDGFVEYQRKTDLGLLNQGWKDSLDALRFADGHPAQGPIALAEVQGYVYAAYHARAELARRLDDDAGVRRWESRAEELRIRFNEAFWLAKEGHYALALDGSKQRVDALASNQGHCLWTGIIPDDRVDAVADHLLSPSMFSGWGVRTLADGMAAYNPVSYHNGSVWPHDNAVLVAGLVRYGRFDAAARIADGLLQAAASFGVRLPELFCGFGRDHLPFPVPYPTACSPQAWAAATPIAMVTALLGIDPARSHIDSHLPEHWGRVQLRGLHMHGQRVDVDSDAVDVAHAAGRARTR